MQTKTQHLAGSLVSAGCDWLTLTQLKEDADSLDLLTVFNAARECEKGDVKQMAPQGFHGQAVGRIFIGENKDRFMFRASSDAAHVIAQEVKLHGLKASCSRIDLQVTFKRDRVSENWAGELRETIRRVSGNYEDIPRITTATYESVDSGSSITINARSAARHCRIYDKTAESRGKLEPGLLRVELELKKAQAQGVFNMLRSGHTQEAIASKLIVEFLDKKRIPHDLRAPAIPCALPSSVYETNEEKRVAWLLRDIAPCVMKVEDPALRRKLRIAFGF